MKIEKTSFCEDIYARAEIYRLPIHRKKILEVSGFATLIIKRKENFGN